MYLLVKSARGKLWRFDYSFDGKRKTLALGTYPDVSLLEARNKLQQARKNGANKIDPNRGIISTSSPTFEIIAIQWMDKNFKYLKPATAKYIKHNIECDVLPFIGNKKIIDLLATDVLNVLLTIENRGAIHVAHRVKGIIGKILRYGIASGIGDTDHTQALRGALQPKQTESRAAIIDNVTLGELLCAIHAYCGSATVSNALLMLAHVFVRPGELRLAHWSEFDLGSAQWRIPTERIKIRGRGEHIVPLSN
ncbi:MAG: integrase arm-type DNA-binding domain-containing protein [Mariprofundales bacterium]